MANNNSNEKPIELKDVYEILSDIHNSIKESSKWTKFAGMKEVKPILETQLPDESKKQIYQLSDGKKGTQEIVKMVGGISHMSIANYWKSWEKVGLGEPVTAMGGKRFKRSFDLKDFGIKVLEIKTETEQTSEPEVESNE